MTSPNYLKIKEVFFAALPLAPETRESFLKQNCPDEDFRREVELLFEARDEARDFLQDFSIVSLVEDSFDKTENKNLINRKIDKYRIEREIGRGGMGVVFLARREDFQQTVALKLIKRGMDSDQILERFKREREILAALNHPNIARLIDGGTTGDGAPFFVMEFVEGVPIDEYCKSKNLTIEEKLKLFGKVCAAVSFAHQKLIVHRDLKPSNILVTADGEPKLLDFGIAKLLDAADEQTQTFQRVLTPAYASPEQMRGEIVSTTSDVYSLGIILKEILTGQKPNRATESEDKKPKAKSRATGDISLAALDSPPIKGDLRNIVSMATRDDATRRYGSVEAFKTDVQRYLDGLPIAAGKDSAIYRVSKFLRRNRIGALIAAVIFLLLTGGITTTLWQAREAKREREIAERRFDDLQRISNSLVFEIHDAIKDLPGSLPARQMLLKRAAEQFDLLAAESGDNAALQDELAEAYFSLTELPDTTLAERETTLRKYLAVYQNLLARDAKNIHYREQIALGDIELGDLMKVRGSINESLRFNREVVATLEQIVKDEPDSAEHRINLRTAYVNAAFAFEAAGDANDVLSASRAVLNVTESLRQTDQTDARLNRMIAGSHLYVGIGLTETGDYKAAISELKTSLEGFENEIKTDSQNTLLRYFLWSNHKRLADAFELKGERQKAFAEARSALSIIENLLAESPKDLGYHRNSALTNLLVGQMLAERGQRTTALKNFRRAAELSEFVLSKDNEYGEAKMDLARARGAAGDILFSTGKKTEGLTDLREAARIYEENYTDANPLLKRDYAEICALLGTDLEKINPNESSAWLEKSSRLKNAAH